jgi:hypothetical protein
MVLLSSPRMPLHEGSIFWAIAWFNKTIALIVRLSLEDIRFISFDKAFT